MTDQATPAQAGGGAQPIADANPIDTIIDGAETDAKETPEAEPAEPNEPADSKPDEPFPKKAINALSRRDKQIGKLKAQNEHMMQELVQLRAGTATKAQEQQVVKDNKGIPTKLNQNDYQNYADYIEDRAVEIAEFKIDQKLSAFEGKNKETQKNIQEQAWESERITAVDKQAAEFTKEHPDVEALFDEYSDVIREYPAELKHALLAADNAPLAFYNLAKDGKLEDLASMSLVDAKVEIRLAQMKEASKPKTKAPTPLPASRGSVASGKSLDSMNGNELLDWINT